LFARQTAIPVRAASIRDADKYLSLKVIFVQNLLRSFGEFHAPSKERRRFVEISMWNERYIFLMAFIELGKSQPEGVKAARHLLAIYARDLADQSDFESYQTMKEVMVSAGTLESLADEAQSWRNQHIKSKGDENAAAWALGLLLIDLAAACSNDPIAVGCGELTDGMIRKALTDFPLLEEP